MALERLFMFGRTGQQVRTDSSLETATGEGEKPDSKERDGDGDPRVSRFLLYAEAELHFSRESLEKYAAVLRQVERQLGKPIADITREDLYRVKSRFIQERLSDNWLASTVLVIKRYLRYLREMERLDALDPSSVHPPKRRYREVLFLTSDEVERFIGSIKLRNADGNVSLPGHRFRAMTEMLLGSALRISELLSLSRGQINPETREAKIVGKGGKERTAFFTARAISSLNTYLALRDDTCEALFSDLAGRRRMQRADIWRFFARHRKLAGIDKKLTPHILRHTAATQLLFNGCPIGHIKEILGHARLETTCRYYLGVDHRAAKRAHEQFLVYGKAA
jgi:Site-specific recombinase XerD